MKDCSPRPILALVALVALLTLSFWTTAARPGDEKTTTDRRLDTAAIERATGAKGTMNEQEGVFKVTFPRDDVKVTVDGTAMPPFMGLTSWAAFKSGMKEEAMVMGASCSSRTR